MSVRTWAARNSQPIMAVIMFGVWAFGYFYIGSMVDPADGVSLATKADEKIPFVQIFIFPYLALYSLFLMPFFLVRDKEFFRVFAWSYITVMMFCYLIFWNFPVTFQHPQIEVVDFKSWALSVLYGADPPVNCFPSMHAAMAMTAALTIYAINRLKGVFALFITFMIGISALLIKQHYIADILGGFGIAAITYYAYFKQRIHETLTRDLIRGYEAVDQYIDEMLEKRLETVINRRVDIRLREILGDTPFEKKEDPGKDE
ncbi:MAG TPA: phosphatase PAP2 family protein [bacterium]|nr:phosphatase PAP2 family protein [bacterium]